MIQVLAMMWRNSYKVVGMESSTAILKSYLAVQFLTKGSMHLSGDPTVTAWTFFPEQ